MLFQIDHLETITYSSSPVKKKIRRGASIQVESLVYFTVASVLQAVKDKVVVSLSSYAVPGETIGEAFAVNSIFVGQNSFNTTPQVWCKD